jgi:hypothetical protein
MNLLLSLLQPDPTRRPRASDVLHHSYFKNPLYANDLQRLEKEQPWPHEIKQQLLLPMEISFSKPRLEKIKGLLNLKELHYRAASHATTWIAYQFYEWIQTKIYTEMNARFHIQRCQEPKHLALAMACHYNENFSLSGISENIRNNVIRYLLHAAEERFIPVIPQLGIPDTDLENFLVWAMFCLGGTLDYHKREAHHLWKCLRERKSFPERIWTSYIGKLAGLLKNEYEIGLALPSQKLLNWIKTTASEDFRKKINDV